MTDFSLIAARVDQVRNRYSYLVRHRLTEREKERLGSFRNKKRRSEWLAGRVAGKEALFGIMDEDQGPALPYRDYQSLAIDRAQTGKPHIVSESKLHGKLGISISHSSNLAVAMASFGFCGVDVQRIDPALERIRKYFVSRREGKLLDGFSQGGYSPRQKLALLWSVKEALKKQSAEIPMPGFRELELVAIQLTAVPVFSVAVPSGEAGRTLLGKAAATVYGRYSLAWTVAEENQ